MNTETQLPAFRIKPLSLPKGTTGFYNDKNEWVCTGSQMGRRDVLPGRDGICKLRLTRLPFVDGAYDRWGAYWGGPANVWIAWQVKKVYLPEIHETVTFADRPQVYVRANSRSEARRAVLAKIPTATFYR